MENIHRGIFACNLIKAVEVRLVGPPICSMCHTYCNINVCNVELKGDALKDSSTSPTEFWLFVDRHRAAYCTACNQHTYIPASVSGCPDALSR